MRQIIITGLALFSMFFGAGNLIFPLLLGKEVGAQSWAAILGLFLTAVVVPFLGLAAMISHGGDHRRFFGVIGRRPGLLLFFLLQLILGPLGVIPRLFTLMHALAKPYLAEIPIGPFSFLVAAVIFGCTFRPGRLIAFLGKILTPVLLISLLFLIVIGLKTGGGHLPLAHSFSESFAKGVIGGYNTMDLIAAFLFATVILPHFSGRDGGRKILLSSLIGASLLLIIYVGLAWVSAYHGWKVDVAPEVLLSAIATTLLGRVGGAIAAIAVITACLTTAITLAAIFAEYLKRDLCRDKIGSKTATVATLITASLFANLGFSGLAALLNPILEIIYPGLIVLTLYNFFRRPVLQSIADCT